jgi:hypothetical protein
MFSPLKTTSVPVTLPNHAAAVLAIVTAVSVDCQKTHAEKAVQVRHIVFLLH